VTDMRDRIFEALVDPETSPEFSFHDIACALREEAFARAEIIEHAFRLGESIGDFEHTRAGIVDLVNRGRILGLAHQFFWQSRPFERKLRVFVARNNLKLLEARHGSGARI